MQTWLARLSFSFLIVGTFLAWEGYQAAQGVAGPVGNAKIILYFLAAMLSYVLGFAGIRQRHKRD